MFISFDLDETLVSSVPTAYCENFDQEPSGVIRLARNGEVYDTSVFVRPGAVEMLESLKSLGTLNIFTHGVRQYAEAVLEATGLADHFERVLTREDTFENAERLSKTDLVRWKCTRVDAHMLKDLRVVAADIDHVVAIDNEIRYYPVPMWPRVIHVPNFDPHNPGFHSRQVEQVVTDMPRMIAEKATI